MAWDSSRPVPLRRLVREWLLFAALMILVFGFVVHAPAASYIGLFASLPLYVGFGAVLAKFGYQRKSFAELRAERTTTGSGRSGSGSGSAGGVDAAVGPRPRPAPTRRTSTGPRRSPPKRKR